jgi:hypothetical protein
MCNLFLKPRFHSSPCGGEALILAPLPSLLLSETPRANETLLFERLRQRERREGVGGRECEKVAHGVFLCLVYLSNATYVIKGNEKFSVLSFPNNQPKMRRIQKTKLLVLLREH